MQKIIRNGFLILISLVFVLLGPSLFKKYHVDYKESYEGKESIAKWKGVITFWDYPKLDTDTGSNRSWINSKIKEYEKSHPGIFIDYRTIDFAMGKLTLRAASKIGACPDIAPVGSDMYFLSSDFLEPLDEYIKKEEKEDFLEDALLTCTYNDTLFGIPWAKMGYTLLLNKDIFQDREVELPPEGFWTYEEFLDSLKKLTVSATKKSGKCIYGLLGSTEMGHYNIYGILLYDKAITEISGEGIFHEALPGLIKLNELKNVHKVLHPDTGNITKSRAFNLFLNGKAAVFLGDAWMVPYLRGIGGKYGLNFATAQYPSKNNEFPPYINDIYYSYGVFKQDSDEKKEACIEFLEFLTNKEFQEELKKFGYFPIRKSANYIYQNDKEMYTIQRGLESAKHISEHKYWWEVDEIFQYAVTDVIDHNKNPQSAMEEARGLAAKYFDK